MGWAASVNPPFYAKMHISHEKIENAEKSPSKNILKCHDEDRDITTAKTAPGHQDRKIREGNFEQIKSPRNRLGFRGLLVSPTGFEPVAN